MDSILTSIKKLLGINETETHFDADITMHINTVFGILTQLGIGPEEGFSITDKYAVWSDFVDDSDPMAQSIKSYIFMKVKLMFDPPASSVVVEAINKTMSELEWRINVAVDNSASES